MAYCMSSQTCVHITYSSPVQVPLSEPSYSECTRFTPTYPTTRLTTHRGLHYHKIVKNEFYVSSTVRDTHTHAYSYIIQGYPDEWFPSVSATIGDRYPERSVFMLFIALTSGMNWRTVAKDYTKQSHRSSIRIGRPLVHLDPSTELVASQAHRWRWHLPHLDMRRMDIRNLNRRPSLPRYLHGLLPRRNNSLDTGLPCADPEEPYSAQISEGPCGRLLRNSSATDLLLPSTQSAPCCRR
jgi:hypothetical protein